VRAKSGRSAGPRRLSCAIVHRRFSKSPVSCAHRSPRARLHSGNASVAAARGVWFRRQVVIGRYIVDFVAPSGRLVVEVDGGYHGGRVTADARSDRALTRLGYRVLRLDAELVLKQPEAAVARIRAALASP
jgi:very-short-patch-repair endonuclease